MSTEKRSRLSLESFESSDIDTPRRVSARDRYLVQKMQELGGRPNIQIKLWDDSILKPSHTTPVATMHIKQRKALNALITKPEIGFGDEYSRGSIDVDNLVEFLCEVFRAKHSVKGEHPKMEAFTKLFEKKARSNTLEGSKSNIHHHYDLGNEFYELWLDKNMQYTCSYFPDPSMTIEQSQQAKMEHVCRKLQLKPGQTVAEAGCGWGSLALYMARNHGVKVKSYNISHEQIVYAVDRAKESGLSDQVEYVEDDYRNISGEYDVFVSVGMLEHVGRQNYQQLGEVVDRVLSKNGRALVHSIGRNSPERMSPWIEKRIFPGAYPPTIREMMDIVEPFNFSVLDIENLRLHYARTLQHWLQRFDENEEKVMAMFDQLFVRAWRLYLSGSIASFLVGRLQLFQMLFARELDNDIPMTREHLYPSLRE